MTVADQMLEVLAHRNRWVKDTIVNRNGRVCLVGARMRVAALLEGWDIQGIDTEVAVEMLSTDPYMLLLARIITEQYPDRLSAQMGLDVIHGFNDHPATRFRDVRAVMEKAAAQDPS